MTRQVAFLTMENPEGFFTYDHLAVGPLRRRGWSVTNIPWDRPDVTWRAYDAAVIRSPWDYQQRPGTFMEVLETIERSSTRLWNSLEVVRWNIHKSYLRDLQQRNVHIVPTRWLSSLTAAELAGSYDTLQAEELVVKPMVGANADDTFRLTDGGDPAVHDKVVACFANRECLVQPYLTSITDVGEYSFFYFDGKYSHAIVKLPATGDFRVQEEHGGLIRAVEPAGDLCESADHALQALPFPTLYARIDLVYLTDGSAAVMEVELIEPSLYFGFDEESPERFAHAFDRCMRGN